MVFNFSQCCIQFRSNKFQVFYLGVYYWIYISAPVCVVDVNECETIRDVCRNGQCTNTEGSYFCTCNPGYEATPDRTACTCESIEPFSLRDKCVLGEGVKWLKHHDSNCLKVHPTLRSICLNVLEQYMGGCFINKIN